ncbi:MAG TPA: MFS transporter [Rectinemataceae bacterium]|nr:MFS transporter [Rectinemataceae bacterium]
MGVPTSRFLPSAVLRIGTAEAVSGVGDWVSMMAVLMILVFHGRGGVKESSFVLLAGLVPMIFASPFAGRLADRFDGRRLMIASQLISGVTVTALAFAGSPAMIYALLVIESLSMSLMVPARQSALPKLLPPAWLTRANAFILQLGSIVKIGAPVLAGALLVFMPPRLAFFLDALSFAAAALILLGLPSLPPGLRGPGVSPQLPGERPSGDSHASGCASGASPRWRRPRVAPLPGLRVVFAAGFFATLVLIGFDVMASVYCRDVLRRGGAFFGLVCSLVGAGSLAASLILGLGTVTRSLTRSRLRDVALGTFAAAFIPIAFILAGRLEPGLPVMGLVTAGCLGGGFGLGLLNVQSAGLIQQAAPPERLGSVSGLFQSLCSAGQLGGALLTPILVPGVLSFAAYLGSGALGLAILAMALALQSAKPWGRPDAQALGLGKAE